MLSNLPRKLIIRHRGVTSNHQQPVLGVLQQILSLPLDKISTRLFQEFCPNTFPGIEHLRNQRLNKGLAFTLKERQQLGIHGLQPPALRTQAQQTRLCEQNVQAYTNDLFKYIYLIELQERNERLFFRLLSENIEMLMPVVYTPTVGLACQRFGLIYRRNRGLFITINDKGHVYEVIKNWPEPEVRAIVVTDGERILGLGDLGAYGMGIPVGKLALYTALAGIKPHLCLPIVLDVGTNNQTLLDDPLYVGLRHKRVSGDCYNEFLDEFMAAVVKRYGQKTLIQFEDFGNLHAFELLDRYRKKYCTFNDDIQGTASVIVAGLLASKRITNANLSDNTFLFLGAGEAALGIANLTVRALVKEGLTTPEAMEKIWMFDIDGLLTIDRSESQLEGHKAQYAKDHAPTKDLAAFVKEIRPTIMIGASAAAGAFTPEILQDMAAFNERPIVFALSNPTSKAECTAEQAIVNTKGRVIFASGSPFAPVTYEGTTYTTGQGNNAYIFPGIALGVIATELHHIKEELFLIAAQVLADHVSEESLEKGLLYPPLSCIREVSIEIATELAEYAFENGMSSIYPEPEDKRAFIESMIYDYNYDSAIPIAWDWPNTQIDDEELKLKLSKQRPQKYMEGDDGSKDGEKGIP